MKFLVNNNTLSLFLILTLSFILFNFSFILIFELSIFFLISSQFFFIAFINVTTNKLLFYITFEILIFNSYKTF